MIINYEYEELSFLLNDTTLRRYALNPGPVALLLGYHTRLE